MSDDKKTLTEEQLKRKEYLKGYNKRYRENNKDKTELYRKTQSDKYTNDPEVRKKKSIAGKVRRDNNPEYHKEYNRTKRGKIKTIYHNQRRASTERGHSMPTYTEAELRDWLYSQKLFHELYDKWKANDYDRLIAPSVDRLDDDEGYSLGNIQLVTFDENTKIFQSKVLNGDTMKVNKAINQYTLEGEFIKTFHSATEASRQTKVNLGNLAGCTNGLKPNAGGFKWEYK